MIEMKSTMIWYFHMLLFLCLCYPCTMDKSFAQEYLDFHALTQETRKISKVSDELTMVWWVPEIIWQYSISKQPYLTQTQIDDYYKAIRAHMFFIVFDGKIGKSGSVDFKTETTVRNTLVLQDNQGNHYQPIAEENIPADTKDMLQTLKSGLIDALGLADVNFTFFLFPAKSPQGIVIADVKGNGSFTLKVGSKNFKWHLPMDSLLPEKKCLSCSSDCKGSWHYCPWCGKRLITYIK